MVSFGPALDMQTNTDPLYVQIVRRLREAIATGQLKVDMPLPSERELAQSFSISRVPVREALKILEFLGVVERVPGKGVVVRAVDVNNVLNSFDFLVTDPLNTLTDLFEARESIETQAVRLAAKRRTTADLTAMERTLIQMEVEIRLGCSVEDTSETFHTAVVDASHNEILIKIHGFLHSLLVYSRKQTLQNTQRYTHVLEYHRKIFTHIKNGNAEAAVASMRDHLHDALSHIETTLAVQESKNVTQ